MTVYNMPIWLRKFTFHKLKTYHDEKNTPTEQENTAIGTDGVVKDPSMFKNSQHKPSPTSIKPGPQPRKPASYK